MKKKINIIALLSIAFIAYAQDATPVHISEYNNNTSSDFQKFGSDKVDVDLYRGQPNINIPLINLSENGLNLNIVLSYKSSGVKVNACPL